MNRSNGELGMSARTSRCWIAWPAAVALVIAAAPAAATRGARLIVASGKVALEGSPGGGWRLEVGAGSAARMMLGAAEAVVVVGAARLSGETPAGSHPRLRLVEGERIALYGAARLWSPTGWQIDLSDGGVLLERGLMYVLAGRVRVAPPRDGGLVGRMLGQGRPGRSSRTLGPRSRVRLGLDGRLSVEPWRDGEAERLERELLLAARAVPAAWEPVVSQPTSTQARAAVLVGRQRQQAGREMASCGCTEGQAGGDTSGVVGQGPANQAVEKRNATVLIRVRGVPPRVKQ